MQTASDIIQEKMYQQGRADAIAEISREIRFLYGNAYEKQIRADAIDEFYNRLIKNKSSMNQANYPWNYVEAVYKEMKGAIDE